MRIFTILPVLVFAAQIVNRPDIPVGIPQTGCQVMIDGVLSAGEWERAARVAVPSVGQIYFQQSSEFVYIAIQFTAAPSGMVDLFLSPRTGEIYDLHASAKLGERHLLGNAFPSWNWWNNRDWNANVAHVESFKKPTFLPSPIREYQIRRSRFPGAIWHVRFELTSMETNNEIRSVTTFPLNTVDNSTEGWLQLRLEPERPPESNHQL